MIWSVAFVTLITLYVARNTKAAIILLGLFAFELWIIVGFTSVIMDDLSPVQFSVIVFAQSMCILGYTFISPRYIDLRISFIALLVVTLIAWGFGLFAFYEDGDWKTAIFLLLSLVLVAFYHTLQIKYADRYHLEQKLKSVVNFYVDPLGVVLNQLKLMPERCKCKPKNGEEWTQLSVVNADDDNDGGIDLTDINITDSE